VDTVVLVYNNGHICFQVMSGNWTFFFCPHQNAGMCDHAVVVGGRSLAGEQMASSPNWAAELAYRSAAELPVGAWAARLVSIHPKYEIAKHPCIAQ